uniref:WW domain-containing protein n=1 Tax=Triparma pacifica TaxID=91992 RepID=A0A7S2VWE8_9STRA
MATPRPPSSSSSGLDDVGPSPRAAKHIVTAGGAGATATKTAFASGGNAQPPPSSATSGAGLMAMMASKVIAINRAKKKPTTLSANALREIDKQKEHRNRVLQAQKVTDTLISRKTVEKWKRLREKNKMKTENPKYDGMALSLKLHTNVINLDAFLRNNKRHRSILANVQAFTNNKESDRTRNYRKLRMRMRTERLKEQEYHMQELASTLRKPKTLIDNNLRERKNKRNGGVNNTRVSSTPPERTSKRPGSSRPGSSKPGSSQNRSGRSSSQRPRTTEPHSDFPLTGSLKMKRPESTISSRGGGTPSAERSRRTRPEWSGSTSSRGGVAVSEMEWTRGSLLEGQSLEEEDGEEEDATETLHHIQHIVTSEANLMNIGYLNDAEFLMKEYKKYEGLEAKEMKETIYDKVMAGIPPIVTKDDIYDEQRREWDASAKSFDREEEEEKILMNLQHLERMLQKFKNAGVNIEKIMQEEKKKRFETTHGGCIDTKTELDSPRLRKLRPYLSEGGQFYSEGMMFPEHERTTSSPIGESFLKVLSFKEEEEGAFEGAEPEGEAEGKSEEEDEIPRSTGFFHEDGFVAAEEEEEEKEEEEEEEVVVVKEEAEKNVAAVDKVQEDKEIAMIQEKELAQRNTPNRARTPPGNSRPRSTSPHYANDTNTSDIRQRVTKLVVNDNDTRRDSWFNGGAIQGGVALHHSPSQNDSHVLLQKEEHAVDYDDIGMRTRAFTGDGGKSMHHHVPGVRMGGHTQVVKDMERGRIKQMKKKVKVKGGVRGYSNPPPRKRNMSKRRSPTRSVSPKPQPIVKRGAGGGSKEEWFVAIDPASGLNYWYNPWNGSTTWHRPQGFDSSRTVYSPNKATTSNATDLSGDSGVNYSSEDE